jgi:histidine ammonia-lyase
MCGRAHRRCGARPRHKCKRIVEVFALSIEAFRAPIEHYDEVLEGLWGDAFRAVAAAERAATISLASASDNPVYIPPDEAHPNGRSISTGGYHNAMAAPALGDLAAIWADVCLLCDRHGSKLLNGTVSHMPNLLMINRHSSDMDGHGSLGYVPMASTGYLE